MQFFYNIVIFIGIGILIFTLAFIGASMYYQKDGVVFPQYISDCPDYWTNNSDGTCSVVVGNKSVNAPNISEGQRKLGNITVIPPSDLDKEYNPQQLTYIYDFNNSSWCDKRKWAMTNDIFWDGITNIRNTHVVC